MSIEIIIQIILFGLALSADAFSVAVTEGLVFIDIDKKKALFIALIFGLFQALFPLIGYWIVEIVTILVDSSKAANVGQIVSTIVSWTSFAILVFLGIKMLIEGIKDIKKSDEEKTEKHFTYKEVLLMGVATAIDALASGVAFHNTDLNGVSISNNYTIWFHVTIIMVITFGLSLCGVLFGHKIETLFKGKYEIAKIIGGIILIILAIWIILSHYFGI